jgi:hypothetical protein
MRKRIAGITTVRFVAALAPVALGPGHYVLQVPAGRNAGAGPARSPDVRAKTSFRRARARRG